MNAIGISPEPSRSPPDLDGFDAADDEWRLDPERYRRFVESATGLSPGADLSASDCYRIGNRLEGFIEERTRAGEWTDSLTEEYPDVESLEEVVGLARFFRRCHDCCLEADVVAAE